MHEKNIIDGELYQVAANGIRDSFYHTVQSGVVLGLAVHFYKQALLPLTRVCTSAGDSKTASHCQKGRLQNWGSVLSVSEELGLWPCLYADEVEQYGAVVLQLHVLRFVEELFAVLATQAEDSQERGESERGPPVSQSITSLRVDRGEDVDCMPLTEVQSQDVMDSVCEKENEEVNLNKYPTEKGDGTSSMWDGGEVNGGPSSRSSRSYPSAHSRRQYDVMMASLQLHEAGNVVLVPPKSNGSPLKLCPSTYSDAPGVVVAITTSSTSSNAGYVLSRTPSQRFTVECRSLPEKCPTTELVDFSVKHTDGIMEGDKVVSVKEPIVVNPLHSFSTSNEQSATVLPLSAYSPTATAGAANILTFSNEELHPPPSMETVLRRACDRYDPILFSGERKLGMLSPLTSTMMDKHNGVRTVASCTTTESSFPVNLIGRLGALHSSREMTSAFTAASLSRPHSPPQWQEEVESQGVSPITPDTGTEQSVVPSQTVLTSAELQRCTFLMRQNPQHRSNVREFRETELRDLMQDFSVVDPSLLSGTSDRHSLLLTLEKQQTLIRCLTSRLEAMKKDNPLRHDDAWSATDGVSTVSEGPDPKRLLRSDADCRTDDSGQRAETDVSSVPDVFLDSERSFYYY
ncbi:hypothetical protein TraAM80_00057 [Trypanosoma rangeli]|uniref:Uncharacterized protein n=1 Tax=Trypanosoma rangeli TaxID=5698 RepID=A0A3R7RTX5_TRYRA|nr:uncharacterized protein TraAM80_00057 [Trypanosoma rangeli]RNF12899.1 hypothetical protein TraAM80_00057 [Trypanosoma rangeli]|eukprot:RNF12899.1 hypothetical protein TraAM80_00057 [Trypanosoma rangeli]